MMMIVLLYVCVHLMDLFIYFYFKLARRSRALTSIASWTHNEKAHGTEDKTEDVDLTCN